MKHSITSLAVLGSLLVAIPVKAVFVVDPTLLSSDGPTLVTTTATGGSRFYTGTTPPPYRVRLTHDGVAITTLTPTSLSPTRLTYLFPKLDAGLYGFVIQAEDSGVWVNVYQSSPHYFLVAADTDPTRVFNGFDPTLPDLQAHPHEFLTTTQVVVSGVITGSVAMAQHISGGVDKPYLKDFHLDGEGDCGIIFNLDFNLDGDAMFHYSIPFQMTLEIPKTVYAGQGLRFKARSFQYLGTDTLTADHTFDSSTYHRLWLNVPYDALSAMDFTLWQQPDKLTVSAKLPLAPDVPPTDITIPPFNTGSGSIGGVTLKLAGHTSCNTSFDHIQTVPDGIRKLWTDETRTTGVWLLDGDQIRLLAEIPIPAVQQVAGVLTTAGVKLDHITGVNVRSTDFIQMKPPFTYNFEVNVPNAWLPGTRTVSNNFSLPIFSSLVSDTVYEMATAITFDMPIIDPISIADWPLSDIYFQRESQWLWLYADFNLNTQVEVLTRPDWMAFYAPDAVGDVFLANYTPGEASAESNRIASLVLTNPPEPPVISTTNQGTFPTKLASEFALMLSINPAAGGTVTLNPPPVDGGYSNGTVVTVTATAARGFQFTGWGGDVTGSANPATITMNDVKGVMANFTVDSGGVPSQVVAWGNDDAGETVVPSGLSNVTAVAAGSGFSCALKADGTVVSWGSSSSHQTNVPSGLSNVAAIASGWAHTLALKADGTVVAWGAGTTNGSYPELGQSMIPAGLSNMLSVSGGSVHSMALLSDGAVAAWGGRGFGETNVPGDLSNVVAVAAGAEFSLALKRDGQVVPWGTYAYGATAPPANLSNVVALAAGWFHALALKQDGSVVAWGAGKNNTVTFPHLGQCLVPEGLSNVIAIAAGNTFSLALKRDGTLAAWGSYYNVPAGGYVPMTVPAGVSKVTAIAAGGNHCLALVNGIGIQTRLSSPTCTQGVFNVSLSTQRGRAYFLESKLLLSDSSWTMQPPVWGDNTLRTLNDPAATGSQRFYRVRRQ